MTTYHLFDSTPALAEAADYDDVSLGTEFIVTARCWMTQFRWLRPVNEGGVFVRRGLLYRVIDGASGTLLVGPIPLATPEAGQWAETDLPEPYELVPGRYKVVIQHPAGRYPAQLNWFGGATEVKGPITVPNGDDATFQRQGTYAYAAGGAYPTEAFRSAAYFSDLTISDTNPTPTTGIPLKTYESGVWTHHTAATKVFINGLWVPATTKRFEAGNWNTL
jgi:hypothetical protein